MTNYKIAIGHDVALVDLDDLIPQPSSPGLQYTRREHAADGTAYDEGPFIPLHFDGIWIATRLQALFTQCGLLSATTSSVTLYAQDRNFVWTRFNCILVKPFPGRQGARSNFLLRGFTFNALVKGASS